MCRFFCWKKKLWNQPWADAKEGTNSGTLGFKVVLADSRSCEEATTTAGATDVVVLAVLVRGGGSGVGSSWTSGLGDKTGSGWSAAIGQLSGSSMGLNLPSLTSTTVESCTESTINVTSLVNDLTRLNDATKVTGRYPSGSILRLRKMSFCKFSRLK